jgi:hypothetical protein
MKFVKAFYKVIVNAPDAAVYQRLSDSLALLAADSEAYC